MHKDCAYNEYLEGNKCKGIDKKKRVSKNLLYMYILKSQFFIPTLQWHMFNPNTSKLNSFWEWFI